MTIDKRAIDIKKKKLKAELSKEENNQNKEKIRRLRESIKRHKKMNKVLSHYRKKNRRKNKHE